MSSAGLRILPIGSVSMVIGASLAILSTFRQEIWLTAVKINNCEVLSKIVDRSFQLWRPIGEQDHLCFFRESNEVTRGFGEAGDADVISSVCSE
jgi:hypothetical protein